MKIAITICLIVMSIGIALAQDSLIVILNKQYFNKGDTLRADCQWRSFKKNAVTLNLWVQNIATEKTWKFRYPLINGSSSLDLKIGDSLPVGQYAVNFVLQPQFFSLQGTINHYRQDIKELVMVMLPKNKEGYFTTIIPDENGNFTTGKLVFEDTAKFVFYANNKRRADLSININNYLDSAFEPIKIHTELISIGSSLTAKTNWPDYKYDEKTITTPAGTLPTVTVFSKEQKIVEVYNKTYTTNMFKGDAKIYDGIEDAELAEAKDIFYFLSKKATGLQITPQGSYYTIYRNGYDVDIFLNENPVDLFDMPFIIPADVAMIKIFEPYTGPGVRGGGAIAIYTKSGYNIPNGRRKNLFLVRGFSPAFSLWK